MTIVQDGKREEVPRNITKLTKYTYILKTGGSGFAKYSFDNGHFENFNFTTVQISVGKRHPLSMATLTICKLL